MGQIQHGDLLSDRGRIVKRNQELLAAFGLPTNRPDAGLDAVQVMPDGEILFSIQSNVLVSASLTLSHGDGLSDRGRVFRTNRELLANFRPAVTNHDYGLDALSVRPNGEIWFSVEEGFTDNALGPIQAGDLLGSLGYRVFSNAQLVADFGPSNPSPDYGLDAGYVIADTKPPAMPPWLLKLRLDHANGQVRVECGMGKARSSSCRERTALPGRGRPAVQSCPTCRLTIQASRRVAPAIFTGCSSGDATNRALRSTHRDDRTHPQRRGQKGAQVRLVHPPLEVQLTRTKQVSRS